MSIASRLRANAATSAAAAIVLASKEHDPGFLASLEQDNALLSEAADALDKALDRVTQLETALTDGHTRAHKQMKTATGEGYTYWQGYADACTAALDTEQT